MRRRFISLLFLIFTVLSCLIPWTAVSQAVTPFYVDADFNGATRNGSASNPWKSLNDAVVPAPWTVVNGQLALTAVTVYHSAREAGSDTSDLCCEITINRTDTSTNRLTLDGSTKWNTNDTTPSWQDYAGPPTRDTPKARLLNQGNGWAIGWGTSGIIPAMDNVTIRGFETSGDRGRFRLEGGGSHFIVEYNYVHDVTGGGPGMQFNAGNYAYSTGPTVTNPTGVCTLRVSHLSTDVWFQYNHIANTADENLYFGGNGEDGSGHGFNCPGHSDIHFVGNTLSNPGAFGIGEGDCFDLKNGNRNVTYTGNIVGPCLRNGIPLQGAAASYQPQNVLVEKNLIHDTNTGGGTGAITLIITWTTVPSGVTIKNNVVYNGSITANDGDANTNGNGAKYNVSVFNNTVDSGNILLKYINTGLLKNNLILGAIGYSQVASVADDYNAVSSGGSSGAHSIALTSGQIAGLFVDRSGRNYQLASASSAAYRTGQDLTALGAGSDYAGNSRPDGAPWDIGAYQLSMPVSPMPGVPTIISRVGNGGLVGPGGLIR